MNNQPRNRYNSPYNSPPRVRRPIMDTPVVTYVMIASCVLVYLGQSLGGLLLGRNLLTAWGAKINDLIVVGQYWRLVTPMWLHGSILHIAFNMYALFLFGRNLERHYGHYRFLLLYLLSGFGGNVISFMMSPNPSVGSSTAIFGLIAAQGVFLYQNRTMIRNAQAMLMNTVMVAAINLFLGLSPGIDNWGHLGGLLAGLAFAWSAGPVWDMKVSFDGYSLENQRSTNRVILVALGVFIVFAAIAVLKISTY
jgi:rhomboid protease GluP